MIPSESTTSQPIRTLDFQILNTVNQYIKSYLNDPNPTNYADLFTDNATAEICVNNIITYFPTKEEFIAYMSREYFGTLHRVHLLAIKNIKYLRERAKAQILSLQVRQVNGAESNELVDDKISFSIDFNYNPPKIDYVFHHFGEDELEQLEEDSEEMELNEEQYTDETDLTELFRNGQFPRHSS